MAIALRCLFLRVDTAHQVCGASPACAVSIADGRSNSRETAAIRQVARKRCFCSGLADVSEMDNGRTGGLAPRAGFEPATIRLTVECSTAELPRNERKCSRGAAYNKAFST